jgi:hypothetical protein
MCGACFRAARQCLVVGAIQTNQAELAKFNNPKTTGTRWRAARNPDRHLLMETERLGSGPINLI